MINYNLEQTIENLKQDYVKYRNMCSFKIKSIENSQYKEPKRCCNCSGYSSVFECWEYVDIPHLIKFYEDFLEHEKKKNSA